MHRACCAALLILARPAASFTPIAEILCEPRAAMVERLERQHGERPIGQGLRSHEEVMELWGDGSGGWTLVMTYATGNSCIVAMGEDWQDMPALDPA